MPPPKSRVDRSQLGEGAGSSSGGGDSLTVSTVRGVAQPGWGGEGSALQKPSLGGLLGPRFGLESAQGGKRRWGRADRESLNE